MKKLLIMLTFNLIADKCNYALTIVSLLFSLKGQIKEKIKKKELLSLNKLY